MAYSHSYSTTFYYCYTLIVIVVEKTVKVTPKKRRKMTPKS